MISTTSPSRRRGRPPARRSLAGRLIVLTLGTSLLVALAVPVGAPTAPDPVGAEPAAPDPPADPAPVPGKGTMDVDPLVLSGPAPDPARGTARATADSPRPTGWSRTSPLRPGTQMVALSWDGTTSGPDGPASARLALRSRTSGGPWTAWLPVAPDPDDQGGEGTGRVGSEVIWLGADGADTVEIRVDAGPVAELELLRLRYHEGEPEAAPDPAPAPQGQARTAGGQPTIRPRSAWASGGWRSGNSGCGSGPSVASRLDHAVVHHTASTNSYTQAQVPGLIDAIYHYHTASLGWCDIAYNFVVDRFGGIWQGRTGDITRPVVGGHAMGFNTGSVGVTLLGQFEPGASPASGQPTTAMIEATAQLLAWKLGLHDLDPKGTVTVTSGGSTRYSSGTQVTLPVINTHQQTSLTACPGANVISRMSTIRDMAAQLMGGGGGPTNPPPPPPPDDPDPLRWNPFADVQTMTYRQYVDFLRHPGTYESRTWWNAHLLSGQVTRNALVASLLDTGDTQRLTAAPVRLYLAYFNRAPDNAGLRYWWDRMDTGLGIRAVSAHFAASSEFRSRYGSLSNSAFVQLVYENVMGRGPDAAGLAYWLGRLTNGQEDRGGVMAQFSESSEYQGRTRTAVEAVITHNAMLQRSITTQAMLEWSARIAANRGALATAIFDSPEYAHRFG